MKSNLLISIFFILGLLSCSSSNHEQLLTDSTINSIYKTNEVEELSKILTYFQNEICSKQLTSISDTLECFRAYMDFLKSNMHSDSINLQINFSSQQEFYNEISQEMFTDIWEVSWKIRSYSNSKKDTLKAIGYNSSGRFMELVKQTGNDHESIKRYHYAIESAGGLSPTAMGDLMAFPENYDISDVRIRLIIAVHYLTFNDDMKRFEKVKISA